MAYDAPSHLMHSVNKDNARSTLIFFVLSASLIHGFIIDVHLHLGSSQWIRWLQFVIGAIKLLYGNLTIF